MPIRHRIPMLHVFVRGLLHTISHHDEAPRTKPVQVTKVDRIYKVNKISLTPKVHPPCQASCQFCNPVYLIVAYNCFAISASRPLRVSYWAKAEGLSFIAT